MLNYNDYIRNLAINYGPSTMPILQTFELVNTYGLEWEHHFYSNILEFVTKNVAPE